MCNKQGSRRPRLIAWGIAKSGSIWGAKKCTIIRLKACAINAQRLNLKVDMWHLTLDTKGYIWIGGETHTTFLRGRLTIGIRASITFVFGLEEQSRP